MRANGKNVFSIENHFAAVTHHSESYALAKDGLLHEVIISPVSWPHIAIRTQCRCYVRNKVAIQLFKFLEFSLQHAQLHCIQKLYRSPGFEWTNKQSKQVNTTCTAVPCVHIPPEHTNRIMSLVGSISTFPRNTARPRPTSSDFSVLQFWHRCTLTFTISGQDTSILALPNYTE